MTSAVFRFSKSHMNEGRTTAKKKRQSLKKVTCLFDLLDHVRDDDEFCSERLGLKRAEGQLMD